MRFAAFLVIVVMLQLLPAMMKTVDGCNSGLTRTRSMSSLASRGSGGRSTIPAATRNTNGAAGIGPLAATSVTQQGLAKVLSKLKKVFTAENGKEAAGQLAKGTLILGGAASAGAAGSSVNRMMEGTAGTPNVTNVVILQPDDIAKALPADVQAPQPTKEADVEKKDAVSPISSGEGETPKQGKMEETKMKLKVTTDNFAVGLNIVGVVGAVALVCIFLTCFAAVVVFVIKCKRRNSRRSWTTNSLSMEDVSMRSGN